MLPADFQSIVAAAAEAERGDLPVDPTDLLPRAPRRTRRASGDRGLPPDRELKELTHEFLTHQRKLWPDAAKTGLLPEPTDAVLAEMVEDFKARHRGGPVDPAGLRMLLATYAALAGAYARFSCDNSDPKSIPDQIVQMLDKAREKGHFIPWSYVFCDYSVSGMDSSRNGYNALKALLADAAQPIAGTYIDDFTRASRLELEWWNLAHQSKRLRKFLYGASDGFDLGDPDWEMKLTIYALLSRLFIKGLQQKVRRGMLGTARRGGTLGKPPVGFTRSVRRDEAAQVVRDADGMPKTELCFDPETQPVVVRIFRHFAVDRWSPYAITVQFNAEGVGGWRGWTEGGIRKILRNPAYVGVFIWNRTHREYDFEAQKWQVVPNPRKEWVVHYDKTLEMVPREWWKKARRELGPEPAMHGRKSPPGPRPPRKGRGSTLFDDTLVCAYCGRHVRLFRSAGKYRDLYCPNGPTGRHGCRLKSSKAARVVEECLMAFITGPLLTEDRVRDLVVRANAHLAEEAARPRADVRGLAAAAEALAARIARLVRKVEATDDPRLTEGYDRRIKDLQRERNTLMKRVADERRKGAPASTVRLDEWRAKEYLADLRAVLGQATPASAEYLRRLTGPIKISQETIPGRKRGHKWIATFSPNLMAVLAKVGADKGYPESVTLEFLSTRNWITPETVEVVLVHKPRYERLAEDPLFAVLVAAGENPHRIALVMGLVYYLVADAYRFKTTGERPTLKPQKSKGPRKERRSAEVPKYIRLAAEVARLKDREGMSFPAIGRQLGMSAATAERAYWYHKRGVSRPKGG